MATPFLRLLQSLPTSLSQRLPILVVAAYLFGAVVTAWTVQSLYQRSNDLAVAETSGEILHQIIRRGTLLEEPDVIDYPAGPFEVRQTEGLPRALSAHSIPLILKLDGDRYRAAISFSTRPQLPEALRASRGEQSAAARLSELARGIARQDQLAQLTIFLPSGEVLSIKAPSVWRDRLGQTRSVLIGLAIFAIGLSIIIPLSTNLAGPFQRLAERGRTPENLGELASTEALLIADRMRRLNERFQHEQDRKTRGLAAISHDLRTPATRMRLRTELLEDDALRGRFEADLDEITNIVDGALDLLSIRELPEETYRFSLVALLESLVTDYRDVGKRVNFVNPEEIDLNSASSIFATSGQVVVKGGAECIMEGQPDKLRRAFSNLIDNALKYGDRACVEVRPKSKNTLEVSIHDFGPGIEPDQIERMLLPFVRGHVPQTKRGIGLGLSIASEIIELHGGSLSFANADPGLIVTATVSRDGGAPASNTSVRSDR